nr:acyltransferase [uncultured Mediterraneibacter sp.]
MTKYMQSKKTMYRNSSIELLRIISMVMIMFHHFAYHGNFEWNYNEITIPHLWYNFILMGGKVGVNIFVLISGFFLIENTERLFQPKKLLKFWGQVVFYSITTYFLSIVLQINNFDIKQIIKICFPITYPGWWFASTYFMLYLIHPFLNKLLHDLNKNVYQYLILLLVFCWSIIPTLTTQLFESNSLLWFITLYAIAGYAKIYGFNERLKSKHYFFLFLIVLVCSYLVSVSFLVLGTKRNELAVHAIDFFGMERFPILLMAFFLFMTFAKLKIKFNKWINVIASATFGVYLIHDSSYIRYYIWWNIFKINQYQESLFLIPYSILVVFTVYVLCTGIEMVRKVLLEKPYIIFVNKYVNLLINPLNKIYELSNKIFE